MRAPLLRLVTAAALLGAYYWFGFATPAAPPLAEAAADPALLRDIDASETAFAAGRHADALGPTERLTARLPTQTVYFARLALIQQALNRPREEARAWERVFRTSPTPIDACPMLPEAYARIPDEDAALDAYARCVAIEPDDPDLLLFLGRAYTAAGRAAEARDALERARAIAPEYPDVYLLLGVRHFADGDIPGARAHFEHFVSLAPDRIEEATVWLERTGAGAR
jgi:tetratricopeptide (TPR) repeat protein